MARLGQHGAEYPWVPLGGSSRRYKNVLTGDTISREKYDRYYGSLFKRGATSFHRAAEAEEEETRLSRPARGRGSARRRYGTQNINDLRPLIGRQSRNIVIPVDIYYDGDGEDDEDEDGGDRTAFYDQAEEYRSEYEDAVSRTQANKAIFSASIIVNYENPRTGKSGSYTILRIEEKHSLSSYDEFIDTIASKAYPGDHFTAIVFHFRFHDQFTTPKKRKAGLKTSKGLKAPKGFKKVNAKGRNS